MSKAIIPIIFSFLIIFLIDLYAFQGLKTAIKPLQKQNVQQILKVVYWAFSVLFVVSFIIIFLNRANISQNAFLPSLLGNLFITLLVTKVVIIVFLVFEDATRLLIGGFSYAASFFKSNALHEGSYIPGRREFISQIAIGVAALPFASFLYGFTKGKYNYKVHKHQIFFKDLPEAFDGFTITQLSDIHSGSFDDAESVKRGVDLAIAQNSDLFVFTGDLVNNKAEEVEPWIDIFSKIKAPFGQFSILGNHDYGDYIPWNSEAEKQGNFERLVQNHEKLGFRLLRDEAVELEKDGQKISLLGVENWGKGFHQKGDLAKTLAQTKADSFKVLLSHDPSHWEEQVKKSNNPIHLTLSGHTHGMQMGVEIPGFRWSPVQYRYSKWAGLYEEAGRFLHINRGFGFLGFKGRVGIWPEISVLELKRA